MTQHKKTKKRYDKIQSSTTKTKTKKDKKNRDVAKCKKTIYKYDEMKKGKLQMWQNINLKKRKSAVGRHIANMTNYKKSKYNYKKIQKKTNLKKFKKTKHECGNIQKKNKIQIWPNIKRHKTDMTKYNKVLTRQKTRQNTNLFLGQKFLNFAWLFRFFGHPQDDPTNGFVVPSTKMSKQIWVKKSHTSDDQ